MSRKLFLIVSLMVVGLLAALPVYAGAPNFGAGLWADDAVCQPAPYGVLPWLRAVR